MGQRWCYACKRKTEHVSYTGSYGDRREECVECGHVNATESEEWLRGHHRLHREAPLGVTLRKARIP